jgi:hypothetical protein
MKHEEHIYFLSELLYAINELQTLVQGYCREMIGGEQELDYNDESCDPEKVPF